MISLVYRLHGPFPLDIPGRGGRGLCTVRTSIWSALKPWTFWTSFCATTIKLAWRRERPWSIHTSVSSDNRLQHASVLDTQVHALENTENGVGFIWVNRNIWCSAHTGCRDFPSSASVGGVSVDVSGENEYDLNHIKNTVSSLLQFVSGFVTRFTYSNIITIIK